MCGNNSRKRKQFMEAQERRRYFGDLSAKDDFGVLQLTALGASQGRAIIGSSRLDPGKIAKQNKKR